jgi:hypothetical protein
MVAMRINGRYRSRLAAAMMGLKERLRLRAQIGRWLWTGGEPTL